MRIFNAKAILRDLLVTVENKSSAVIEMGDRLATIDKGREVGGCCAFFGDRRSEAEATAAHKH